ncbi:hypothetical protein I2I05_08890 [Hymenobacter sp. BT683]|uniref:DUF4846 domain-containing protein n=1 Tax=Hymenobacter jeongseonensis TaxID=2791027 RepID=A0ABS0IGM7_9BACT|nr:DUF4846 domain-containing protein [Hymenobacter jeongseonensis]MBF9237510.1 hypothetical protein [Hymenobacter jeongseonensis]
MNIYLLLVLAVTPSLATPKQFTRPPILPAGIRYPWLAKQPGASATVAARFPAPAGCRRVAVTPGSWGEWLRYLPLQPPGTPARTFNGGFKNRQDVVAAVVDIDVGTQDLQQCADAVIRLRAEYIFTHNPRQIHFHLTTGFDFRFADYVAGRTFKVIGEQVLPAARPAQAPTHAALMSYLIPTFGYAGTLSLSRELLAVPLAGVQPGDVLIHGGRPGHAVVVVDVARHPTTRQQYLLLAQSYMPAQSIHVLRNVDEPRLGAWFAVPSMLQPQFFTPEWNFDWEELGRFSPLPWN